MNKHNFLLCIFFMSLSSMVCTQQLHHRHKDLPCHHKVFNVDVHVVLDSTGVGVDIADIYNNFAVASEKFSPICLDFKICKIDSIYNYNFDSIPRSVEYEELSTKYASEKRINVFILSLPFVQHNGAPTAICGLAGSSIFLKKSCMDALTHELGHFFGLLHTFENPGIELVNGSNCETAGDGICDTPADPYQQFDPPSNWIDDKCRFKSLAKDANGEYYIPQTGNVMSYYGCPCQEFTRGQFLRMSETYIRTHKRLW